MDLTQAHHFASEGLY